MLEVWICGCRFRLSTGSSTYSTASACRKQPPLQVWASVHATMGCATGQLNAQDLQRLQQCPGIPPV